MLVELAVRNGSGGTESDEQSERYRLERTEWESQSRRHEVGGKESEELSGWKPLRRTECDEWIEGIDVGKLCGRTDLRGM